MKTGQDGFESGSPLQRIAGGLLDDLERLYLATNGRVKPDDPALARLVPVIAIHGRAIWLAYSQDPTPQGQRLRQWLHDLATAPPKQWQPFRQKIIPLVRCVGGLPRRADLALLSESAMGEHIDGLRVTPLSGARLRRGI